MKKCDDAEIPLPVKSGLTKFRKSTGTNYTYWWSRRTMGQTLGMFYHGLFSCRTLNIFSLELDLLW
jgi:hypothetical protein